MTVDIYPVEQDYGIDRWGEGYFGINTQGNVIVRPDREGEVQVDLHQLAHEVRDHGLNWPVLIRFTDILHDRVAALCSSFRQVFEELEYRGNYSAIYPIKVNQQRSVVEEILAKGCGCVGLEAGSKPELMVVLDQAPDGGVIVCNGYKDREYIRLALIGRRLGHQIYIVIEKPSELELVLQESRALDVEPLLGVRVRLAASAKGKWQDSGGEKAKFGLNAGQVLALINRLRSENRLHWLQLLHSHIGSQIPNLRDIRRCTSEAARFYGELRRLGADIRVVDLGGGLGVDYEGTGSRHQCSINYSLDAYAREAVKALIRICNEQGLSHPDIYTESGRAMTAHHAMLMVNVIDSEPAPAGLVQPIDEEEELPAAIQALANELDAIGRNSPTEVYQESLHGLEEARELFQSGHLSLEHRALAEAIYFEVCHRLKPLLRVESRRQRDLLEKLNEKLADRLFCNFSLFQSLPDVWAIDQVFPVMPLHRLLEMPDRSAVLHDLTCDSDGCIENYVDRDGVESSLPVHQQVPGEPYLLGIFLVGAYQEILGDMHNLFGDTDAVNLELDGKGGYRLTQSEKGDSVDEMLSYVHFSPKRMLQGYEQKLQRAGIEGEEASQIYGELEEGLYGYTYFED